MWPNASTIDLSASSTTTILLVRSGRRRIASTPAQAHRRKTSNRRSSRSTPVHSYRNVVWRVWAAILGSTLLHMYTWCQQARATPPRHTGSRCDRRWHSRFPLRATDSLEHRTCGCSRPPHPFPRTLHCSGAPQHPLESARLLRTTSPP